jgi:CRISPR/Cas system CMR-associated protein Cmr5 small subunit
VNTGQLEFQVVKPRIKWGTYFQDLFRPKFGGGFESYSGKEPSVVAQNASGENRVIAVFRSLQEAVEAATVIENDFKTLGVAAWCERYDVPLNFVS